MLNRKLKSDSIWPAVLAICMTIVISSAATATAAKLINGKNIKKGTVTGAKLKKNTLTGTQINESKLGTVPSAVSAADAGTLGGVGAAGFVKGSSHIYSGSKNVSLASAGNLLLEIPGFGQVTFDCDGFGGAYPNFVNNAGDTLKLSGSSAAINVV